MIFRIWFAVDLSADITLCAFFACCLAAAVLADIFTLGANAVFPFVVFFGNNYCFAVSSSK